MKDGEVVLRDDGLFSSDVDEGRCVNWADVLVLLLKNAVFNDFDCVPDVIGYASVVW